jgi:hypothetical protein
LTSAPGYIGTTDVSEYNVAYKAACDRMNDFKAGKWCYIGVRARAVIEIPYGSAIVAYQLFSPGVWGVESDAMEDYLNELFMDEVGQMKVHFEQLRDFDAVIKNQGGEIAMHADFIIADHGSIALLTPASKAGREWANEHLPQDAMYWNGAIVIEPRYVDDIIEGIQCDGLSVM